MVHVAGDETGEAEKHLIFDKLWLAYDQDKSGYLDEAELKPLLVSSSGIHVIW